MMRFIKKVSFPQVRVNMINLYSISSHRQVDYVSLQSGSPDSKANNKKTVNSVKSVPKNKRTLSCLKNQSS